MKKDYKAISKAKMFERDSNTFIKMGVMAYKDRKFLDVRIWLHPIEKEDSKNVGIQDLRGTPTQRGVTIPVDKIPLFISSLQDLIEEAFK